MPQTKQSTFNRALVLIPISLIPLFCAIAVIRVRFVQRLLVYPMYLGFFSLGYFAAKAAFNFFNTSEDENAPDKLAVAGAFIVGFGIIVLCRVLVTHEMARAFSQAMPDDDD